MVKRPIIIDGDTAYVPLTQGFVAVIDAVDVPLVEGYNWCAQKAKHTTYAVRSAPRDEHGKQRVVLMHRVIAGDPPGMDVDHENQNGCDNRRANLRAATRSENLFNQRLRSTNTSGVKGVSFDKASGRWRASIAHHNVKQELGSFATKDLAAAARGMSATLWHRQFKRTL